MITWGFTGTRTNPTTAQRYWLDGYLGTNAPVTLHHGACVGSDELAHQLSLAYGHMIVVHPPVDGRWMMQPDWNHDNVIVLPHEPYHVRDRDIVTASDLLIALPNSPRRPDSGTWYTIDYALGRHVPVVICWPDGRIERL